jgi:hypothetical protein
MSFSITANGTALRRRDNRITSAGTVAKFINNCSLLLLLFNRVTSDETMAEISTDADCYQVSPACAKLLVELNLR